MIDLNPHQLDTVISILETYVPNDTVIAFGSRVKWNASDFSDLDLVVCGTTAHDFYTMGLLREALDESDLPIRVDVHDWNSIPEHFKTNIENSFEVLVDGHSSFPNQARERRALGDCATRLRELVDPQLVPTLPYIGLEHIGEQGLSLVGHGRAVDASSAKVIFSKGDILFGSLRPYFRKIIMAPFDGVCSLDIWVLRASGCIDQQFLFYSLASPDFVNYVASGSLGTALPRAKWDYASSYQLHCPPLSEQRRIARSLGALDDRIALNRRMSETLEAMAQALFQSWFVDFEPVRAKAEGRPSGLPPDLDALFPSSFEKSELGAIPEGWRVCSLDDIAEFTNGLALQRFPPDGEDSLPAIKISEMRHGYTHKTGRASASIDSRYIVEDGDMLLSWSGSLQVVLWSHGRGALNQHLFKVTSDKFPQWFYWGWTLEHLDDFRSIAAGKATTMGHIQRHHLTNARVVTPPMEVLRAAGGLLAALIDRHVDNAVQSRELVEQREALLPRLLSGKLRMGGVQRSVGATA